MPMLTDLEGWLAGETCNRSSGRGALSTSGSAAGRRPACSWGLLAEHVIQDGDIQALKAAKVVVVSEE